jgi:hypothetical protein
MNIDKETRRRVGIIPNREWQEDRSGTLSLQSKPRDGGAVGFCSYFGHGMQDVFDLTAAEVDFVYLNCISVILYADAVNSSQAGVLTK